VGVELGSKLPKPFHVINIAHFLAFLKKKPQQDAPIKTQ
jgi:hypothetical protein